RRSRPPAPCPRDTAERFQRISDDGSPVSRFFEEQKSEVSGRNGKRPKPALAQLRQAPWKGMAHDRRRSVHDAESPVDELEEGIVVFASDQSGAKTHSFVKAGPSIEKAAPKGHIRAIADAAKVCDFKP